MLLDPQIQSADASEAPDSFGTFGVRAEKRSRALAGRRKRLGILGTPIDNLTLEESVAVFDRYIRDGGFHQVATANVDFLIKAIKDNDLSNILNRCALVLPDGMPIVWASRLLRHPLRERVTGADLVPRLAELAARKSYSLYLLGAEESRAAAAAAWIERTYPGARVVGRCSPAFCALKDMDHESILRDIEAARPDILFVAFGNPKQEKWIAMHAERLRVPVCVGVGGSLNFLSGVHHRAPVWMQQAGLEWLHRLLQEPRRLAPRYLSNASGLLRYLSLQLLAMRAQRRSAGQEGLSQRWAGEISIVTAAANFSGTVVTDFESLVYRTCTCDCPIILDLSHTQYLGADALGALISLRRRMQRENRKLWLASVQPGPARVLRASVLGSRFPLAPDIATALYRIEGCRVAAMPSYGTQEQTLEA